MDRLCGGTFFVLLSNARKPMSSKGELIKGKSSGLSEQDLLLSLAHLVYPELGEPAETEKRTVQNGVNSFRSCKNKGGNFFRLNDNATISAFKARFFNDYSALSREMQSLVETFIETQTSAKKDEYLVKALIEVIMQDEEIKPEQVFYVGKTITKQQMGSMKDVNLPSFLLGIWYFVITEIDDIRIGKETYDRWCPAKGGGRRDYKGTIGESSNLQITLTYSISEALDEISQGAEKPVQTSKTPHKKLDEIIWASGKNTLKKLEDVFDALPTVIQKPAVPQIPEIPAEELNSILLGFSREYYQLIITNNKIFDVKFVDIPLERAFYSSLVPEEIHNRCSHFTKEGIAELLTFPAIVCNENTGYNGNTDDDQLAIFAQITKIKKGEKEVRIYYRPIATFHQTLLNVNSIDYGLSSKSTLVTLNTSQWTFRAIDLLEAFDDTGADVPLPVPAANNIISSEFKFGNEIISESDFKNLQSFYKDYDDIIYKCFNTDFAEELIDAEIPELINCLYHEKWALQSLKFQHQTLRDYVFSVLSTLEYLCSFLTYEFVRMLPDGKYLRMRHETYEDDDRNDEIFRPATMKIRYRLRNLFFKLHPEYYPEILNSKTTYEELFSNWAEGEEDIFKDEIK